MKPGDEVLMTDQEHPGGEHPWNLKAKRYGDRGEESHAAAASERCGAGAEPFQRRHHAAHPRDLLQPHHDLLWSGAAGEGTLRAGSHERHSLSGGRRACSGHDAVERARHWLRHVFLSPHKWLQATKGSGFLYVRDEVIDRVWNTIATEGWDDTKIRAERFQRIGSSNVPALWGCAPPIKMANDIGIERIERRHRALADYHAAEMNKRGAVSWTSPDPAFVARLSR